MRHSVPAATFLALVVYGAPHCAQDLIYASPRPIYSPAPNYTGAAEVVAVQLRIDQSGLVTDARVLSGPEQLQSIALETAKTWKFEPTIIAGAATPVVTSVNLRFGASLPAVALPATAGRFGIFAAIGGDKVIGTLKWEVREEASGKILASGDGPVHLRDVEIGESSTATGRRTPKTIRLTDEFTIQMGETPVANVSDKILVSISAGRTDIPSFGFEAFILQDRKRAVKKSEGEVLGIDLKQVNGDWEVTRTEFLTDVSLRITRLGVDPPGSPLYWRINISKGSNIIWPSIAKGKIIPN